MKVCRIGDENSQTFSYCSKSTAFLMWAIWKREMKYCSRAEGMLTCGIKFVSYMENYLNPKDNNLCQHSVLKWHSVAFFFFLYIYPRLCITFEFWINLSWSQMHVESDSAYLLSCFSLNPKSLNLPVLVSKVLSFYLVFVSILFDIQKKLA